MKSPLEERISRMAPEQNSGLTEAPEVRLLQNFIGTSTLLALSGSLLSQNMEASFISFKVHGLVLILLLSISFLWRFTRSIEVSILTLFAYLTLVLWVRNALLLIPLLAAAASFLISVGPRSIRAFLLDPTPWIQSVIAAGLITSVTQYGDFQILEKLRQALLHPDTLFHASIASMIKSYGVVSTGMHGVVEYHYHILSHQLIASLSILSGVHVLELYGFVPIMLLCPLLISAITWCASSLSPSASHRTISQNWLIVCAILILLKIMPLELWASWDDYFVSESYTFSLSLFMMALPTIVSRDVKPVQIACAAGLLLLAGLSKGSVGIFALSLLWIKALWRPGSIGRIRMTILAFVVTAAFVYTMLGAVGAASARTAFMPFYYLQKYSAWGKEVSAAMAALTAGQIPETMLLIKALAAIGAYMIINYILSWAIILRRLHSGGVRAVLAETDSFFTLSVTGLSIVTLMFVISGGEWYFINPPMFVAFPFVVKAVGSWLRCSSKKTHVAVTAFAFVGVTVALATDYIQHGGGAFTKSPQGLITNRAEPSDNIGLLMSLRDDRRVLGTVIFKRGDGFPHDNSHWDCSRLPFVYPAVTERAWIGVIEPNVECEYRNYSYKNYLVGTPRRLVNPVIPQGAQVVTVNVESPGQKIGK